MYKGREVIVTRKVQCCWDCRAQSRVPAMIYRRKQDSENFAGHGRYDFNGLMATPIECYVIPTRGSRCPHLGLTWSYKNWRLTSNRTLLWWRGSSGKSKRHLLLSACFYSRPPLDTRKFFAVVSSAAQNAEMIGRLARLIQTSTCFGKSTLGNWLQFKPLPKPRSWVIMKWRTIGVKHLVFEIFVLCRSLLPLLPDLQARAG